MFLRLYKNFLLLLVYLLPLALIGGLIDYRFHNYYWPNFDFFQLLDFTQYFDYFSFYTFFAFVLVVLVSFYLVLKIKLNKVDFRFEYLLVFCFFLALILGYFNFEPMEPYIKSFRAQYIVNFLVPFFSAFSLYTLLDTNKKLKTFEVFYLIFFGILIFLSFLQFYFQILPGESKDFLGRLVWPYIDPFVDMKAESANLLAYLVSPLILLSTFRLLNVDKFKFKYIFQIFIFVLSVWVLLLTKSYTAFVAVIAVIFLYLFKKFTTKARVYLLISSFLLLGFLVLTQYKTPKFQVLLGHTNQVSSVSRRAQIYKFNLVAAKEVFWEGIGPGSYQAYFRNEQVNYLKEVIPEKEIPPHPHNLIFAFYFDFGFLGLMFILSIYLYFGIYFFRVKKPEISYFVFLYFLIHGVFDLPYGLEEISTIFMLFLALFFSEKKNNEAVESTKNLV